ARVDAIDAFQPDITLVLHYDADVNSVSNEPASKHDGTKIYVPGAFDASELASRRERVDLAKLFLDETTFRASVALAHQVVTTLSKNLKIPPDGRSPGITKEIEPGLY